MNEINFQIEDIEKIDLSMDVGVKEIFPPIENLEVNPNKEQQVFSHENSYGYDEVIVNPIPDEYIIPVGTLDVNANGDVDVTMFRMARVGVYTPPKLQDKEVTPTKETQTITSDSEYDGLNQVTVNPIPSNYIEPSGTLNIIENGTYDVKEFAEVTTNIEGSGGIPEITNTEDVTNLINACINQIYDTIDTKYAKYMETPVTLYTPSVEHKYYMIRKDANGKYQPIWLSVSVLGYQNATGVTTGYFVIQAKNIRTIPFNESKIFKYGTVSLTAYLGKVKYDTLDEAIEAIQRPTEEYTSGQYGSYASYDDDGYKVACTNMVYVNSKNDIEPLRKISSNETIEVIS